MKQPELATVSVVSKTSSCFASFCILAEGQEEFCLTLSRDEIKNLLKALEKSEASLKECKGSTSTVFIKCKKRISIRKTIGPRKE